MGNNPVGKKDKSKYLGIYLPSYINTQVAWK